jgi:hypothetical protein
MSEAAFTLHSCEICGGQHYDLRNCVLLGRKMWRGQEKRLEAAEIERREAAGYEWTEYGWQRRKELTPARNEVKRCRTF